MKWFTRARRKRIYRTLPFASALLVFYGILSDQEAALWVALLGQALGNELAAQNVTPVDDVA